MASIWRRNKDSPPLKRRTLNLLHRRNGQRFWEFQAVLFFHFLIEQWTINAAYYSKLLKERSQPAFRQSNAHAHTAAMTRDTLEEICSEVMLCPYSPGAMRCSPVQPTQRQNGFIADDEGKHLVEWWHDDQPDLFWNGAMKLPERWRQCIEVQGECVQKLMYFLNNFVINKLYKESGIYWYQRRLVLYWARNFQQAGLVSELVLCIDFVIVSQSEEFLKQCFICMLTFMWSHSMSSKLWKKILSCPVILRIGILSHHHPSQVRSQQVPVWFHLFQGRSTVHRPLCWYCTMVRHSFPWHMFWMCFPVFSIIT
jgi:hypothetical protein